MARRAVLLGLLLVGVALVVGIGWWFARPQPVSFQVVLRGSSSSNEKLGITGGNLAVVAPQPGVFFGTVRKPDEDEQFTYVILFRYDLRRLEGSSRSLRFDCSSSGGIAETNNTIEIDGRQIDASYHIQLNEAATTTATEQLTIGGKNVDISSGKVFLVNLTEEPMVYHQKNVKLPAITSTPETPQDVEQLARTIRVSLADQDPDIKAFLQ